MNYLEIMKEAFFFFPFIAMLFTVPFMLYQYRKYGSINFFRALIIYSFILYMITIYFLVILPLPKKEEIEPLINGVRLIPLSFIKDILIETPFILKDPNTYLKTLMHPAVYTVVFNIFMTIPFGMYIRYYFKCNLKKTILLSFSLSLFFELTQLTGLYFYYPYPYRIFDVDDLITNTLGGLIGYLLMGLLTKYLPTREEIDEKSKEQGKTVSGLRRITIFLLDLFLFLTIILLTNLFIKQKYLKEILFIIYYIVIPYLIDGTLGSRFLKVKVIFQKKKLWNIILRILFLFFYYFYALFFIFLGTNFLIKKLNVTLYIAAYLYVLEMLLLLIFYLTNIFLLMKNKTIFYDKILKQELRSTIE